MSEPRDIDVDAPDLDEAALDADAPAAPLDALARESKGRLVPAERDWDAIEAKLFARIDADDADADAPDLDEATLDADAPSPLLAALSSDAKDRLAPAERAWESLERRVLDRVDEELDADASGPELEALTRESREHLVPPPSNGARTLAKVEARVARERGEVVRFPEVRWRGVLAAAAIAAAAVGLWVKSRGTEVALEVPAPVTPVSAGVLAPHQGQVRVDGVVATAGASVHAGNRVEVTGSRAVFDQKGRVTWALEDTGRARVSRTEGGLVLALEQGATEAQVVPVPNGEAFAVDVADEVGHVARIAVHGTHLRVARAGRHVVIDLTEGVVTVGVAPRAGSTFGTLVMAPAHVELDVDDLEHVRVDHAATAVRPAAPLAVASSQPTTTAVVAAADTHPDERREPLATATATKDLTHPTPSTTQPIDTNPNPPPIVEMDPQGRAIAASKACFAQGKTREVHVSVAPVLEFNVEQDGSVRAFRFDPPLDKETQDCVGATVFTLKMPERAGETVRIPLELSR